MLKNKKFNVFIIFLILFIAIGSISASEDISQDASLAVCDDGDLDLIENSNENQDFDSVSLYCEDNADVENLASVDSSNSNDLGDSEKNFSEIQDLIDYAEAGDTILLNGTYIGSGKEINVNKSLTIDGQGSTTLDAQRASSIFSINASNFILKNIILCNSSSSAVIIEGTDNSIQNCCFENNTALTGSAVFGPCSILDCNFSNNVAYNNGIVNGAYSVVGCNFIYNCGYDSPSAIYVDIGDSFIANCTFINNSADDGYGSVIHMSSLDSASIENCTFADNSGWKSGPVFIEKSNSFSIVNCSFNNNSAYDARSDGGAIYVDHVNSSSIVNCNFTDNNASRYGAIFTEDINSSSIVNCSFLNNHANAVGAIACWDINLSTIMDCTFKKNFSNNTGVIAVVSRDSRISNCVFINNSAIYNKPLDEYGWDGYSGAIYLACDYSEIDSCSFISNTATYRGGAIFIEAPYTSLIKNSTFTGNSANEGGAIFGICTVIDCNFTNNSAKSKGGAIYGSNVNNCIFNGNSAVNGGAIFVSDKNSSIINSNFTKNTASDKGGAIEWPKFATGKIDGCIFNKNSAKVDGGAIDWNIKDKNITNCKFTNNTSPRENNICGLYTLSVSKAGTYAGNIVLTMKLYNAFSNKPAKNGIINLTFTNSKGKKTFVTVNTNAQGVAKYFVAFPADKYTVTFKSNFDLGKKVSLTVKSFKAKLTAYKLITTYKSGKLYNVRMVNTKTKQKPTNVKIGIKLYTGKKYKTYYAITKNGLAQFDLTSSSVGTHKLVIYSALSSAKATKITRYLVIKKGSFKASAAKVKNKLKKDQYFKVKVISKNTKKPAKDLKVKVKVYTGKKYKTYNIKTNAKGIAQLNTKSIAKGTHNVVVNSGDKYGSFTVKSSIVIV